MGGSIAAADEIRTFTLGYVLEGAVLKHEDVAEFYYKFVGAGWAKLPPGPGSLDSACRC